MDHNKGGFSDKGGKQGGEPQAPRARNRTVMLTPEMTGQVRARLLQEAEAASKLHEDSSRNGWSSPKEALQAPEVRPGIEYHPSATQSPYEEEKYDASSSKGWGEHQGNTNVHQFTRPPQGYEEPRYEEPRYEEPRTQELYEPIVEEQKSSPRLASWAKETPVVGFLVSFDDSNSGEIVELRSGRMIVTSDPSQTGSILYLNDESVSPMHAIMRVSPEGEVQILDQLSECGTTIVRLDNEEEKLVGEKAIAGHGDIVKFGERSFEVCLLPSAVRRGGSS